MKKYLLVLLMILTLNACSLGYGGGWGVAGGSNTTPALNVGLNFGTNFDL
ncbi:hypothetical protein [Actinobacillus delphinicola]|uniref:Uncharacterized protein n=1 Tax=Actinobacillus delphinicola TaxID=51161 RepID=A0A448TT04_9PAST|nr:hypothetical protein [Actinobacillus delphinicola]VEJ09164.1 Uncharacterised protein [Actinobacillus delphinicola]